MRSYPSCPAAYMITHRESGHFYVGSASNLVRRLRDHRYKLNIGAHKNDQLSSCYTTWDDFEIRFEVFPTHDEALDCEDDLIDKFINQELCCNLGTGSRTVWENGMPNSVKSKISLFHKGRDYGESFREMRSRLMTGVPRTDEQKRKLSLSLSGRTRSKEVVERMSASRKGWQPTDETRERMSAAKKGKPGQPTQLTAMKEAVSKPVMVNYVRYSSASDAARSHGIAPSTALQRIHSKTSRFKDWCFI